jgi:hypothetical protein
MRTLTGCFRAVEALPLGDPGVCGDCARSRTATQRAQLRDGPRTPPTGIHGPSGELLLRRYPTGWAATTVFGTPSRGDRRLARQARTPSENRFTEGRRPLGGASDASPGPGRGRRPNAPRRPARGVDSAEKADPAALAHRGQRFGDPRGGSRTLGTGIPMPAIAEILCQRCGARTEAVLLHGGATVIPCRCGGMRQVVRIARHRTGEPSASTEQVERSARHRSDEEATSVKPPHRP